MSLGVLLLFHSWFRWAVVLATLAVGSRCAFGWMVKIRWTRKDESLGRLWVVAMDVQVTLGLLLYFSASPMGAIARQDFRWAWSDPSLRFFGILHPLSMVAAAVITHATWIWTRRMDTGTSESFRRLGIGVLGALMVVVLAIPWPFLSYGRPLARM